MTPSISNCPECGYSLEGLPARHRCPECGFAYDEHTRVWKPSKPRNVYRVLMASLGTVWFQTSVETIHFIKQGFRGWMEGMFFVAWIPLTVYLAREVWRAIHSNQRGRYVAIGATGIHVRTTANTLIIPWQSIIDVTYDWTRPSPVAIEVDNTAIRETLKPILKLHERASSIYSIIPQSERMEFADVANEALQRARATTEFIPNDDSVPDSKSLGQADCAR